eukprot:5331625-Prymnesium_polylepis.1
MLSAPEDYDGAELQHYVDSAPATTSLRLGDAAFYRSHQVHRVTPLERGRRVVMALEWWHVPPS